MSEQQTAFEREMARKNNSVVVIRNIDNEDFTHNYDGFPYTLKAGEQLPFPYPVGMLMARHLAMKLARKDAAKAKDFKQTTDKKSVNLYLGKTLQKYLDQIVVSRIDKPLPPHKSEGERMAERTREIQSSFPTETQHPQIEKRDVIDDLRKRGIQFDARSSTEELLALLTEAEMNGNTGDDSDQGPDQVGQQQ